MCYRVAYLKKKALMYAKYHSEDPDVINQMELDLEAFTRKIGGPKHQASGFDYPELPVITNEQPNMFNFFTWGLIPGWAKADMAAKIRNSTINARSEAMFQTGSFKEAAASRRCLVVVDGYFDHHHHSSKKKIPHYIKLKNDDPMTLAGLWERWYDSEHDIEMETVSIVTTAANQTMQKVHNNPEMLKREFSDKSRMPVIIPKGMEDRWIRDETITDGPSQKMLLEEICLSYPDEEMEAYPCAPLNRGKEIINSPEVNEPYNWPELTNEQLGLF